MNTRRSDLFVLPGLVLANLAVLFLSIIQEISTRIPWMTIKWGLIPRRLTEAIMSGSLPDIGYNLLTMLTSTFLHAGFDHYFNNMALLLVMGILVERELGSARFLAIYLVSGFASSFGHYLFHAFDYTPLVGASGAISGVMGAFLVVTFCLGQRLTMPRMLGALFVIYWVSDQLISIYLDSGTRDGIAYFAHFGGFIGGLLFTALLAKFLRKRLEEKQPRTPPSSTPDD